MRTGEPSPSKTRELAIAPTSQPRPSAACCAVRAESGNTRTDPVAPSALSRSATLAMARWMSARQQCPELSSRGHYRGVEAPLLSGEGSLVYVAGSLV